LRSRPCGEFDAPALTDEAAVEEFLRRRPPAFCNDELHPYPERWSEEKHFRWTRDCRASELRDILESKTGINFGKIRELRPLKRGASGRIVILEIVGSDRTTRFYRELEIRRILSPSHLPSSCFVVETDGKGPDVFRFIGGGWGHGVGLCQLGAVAMANNGWSVERILEHYYPGAELASL
jgi:stage II sporulation protein D